MRKALTAIALAVYVGADAAPENGAYFHHKTVNIPHDDKIGRAGEDAARRVNLYLCWLMELEVGQTRE